MTIREAFETGQRDPVGMNMDEEVMKWGREVGFMRAIVLAARIARSHGNSDAAEEIYRLSFKSHELANESTAP
jgi:hypothetical protein